MSSSLQLLSEDNLIASLASVRSEPLLDHSPSPTYQQSPRSRSAAGARNHEKNKSDNIIYPLEEQANQLEQQSGWYSRIFSQHKLYCYGFSRLIVFIKSSTVFLERELSYTYGTPDRILAYFIMPPSLCRLCYCLHK